MLGASLLLPAFPFNRPDVAGLSLRSFDAALVSRREGLAARVDRRAACDERVSVGRATVVLERAEGRIGIFFVALPEKVAGVVSRQVVALGGRVARGGRAKVAVIGGEVDGGVVRDDRVLER